MELILVIFGALACLFAPMICILSYRRGVKDGMSIKNGTLSPIKNPITQIKESHEEAKKRSEEHDVEKSLGEQFQALFNFQPKYTGDKE